METKFKKGDIVEFSEDCEFQDLQRILKDTGGYGKIRSIDTSEGSIYPYLVELRRGNGTLFDTISLRENEIKILKNNVLKEIVKRLK